MTKTDEFSSVFSFRRTIKSAHFLLHYRHRAEGGGARLGVVIAKRLLRRAVDRNLMRRLARERFRKIRASLMPRDLILRLVSRPEMLGRRVVGQTIGKEIETLLEKCKSSER